MAKAQDDFSRLRHEEEGGRRWNPSGWEAPAQDECGEPFFDASTAEVAEPASNWASSLTEAVGKLEAVVEERRREQERIDRMAARLEMIESKIRALEKPNAIVVPITVLEPEPFDLLREIKVVVEQLEEDEYLATFFDAGISSSGCNPQEAVDGLKELLMSRFEYLNSLPPERMGPIPTRQIAVLRAFLRKRG